MHETGVLVLSTWSFLFLLHLCYEISAETSGSHGNCCSCCLALSLQRKCGLLWLAPVLGILIFQQSTWGFVGGSHCNSSRRGGGGEHRSHYALA